MDIDTESEDPTKKGWKKLRIMFKEPDCQALQTLIDDGTITPEGQKIPIKSKTPYR